jgi:hypothetical protein
VDDLRDLAAKGLLAGRRERGRSLAHAGERRLGSGHAVVAVRHRQHDACADAYQQRTVFIGILVLVDLGICTAAEGEAATAWKACPGQRSQIRVVAPQ